ncbi:hypothetical protein NT6N_22410 [Oceaniferula spumae]|uniref:PEP-CTERM sorting domain-containing protein n=1 Tax=Oceaniferula spumae TaxID=2979115 RepID=A0AAT9FMQ8_9BACT
MKHIILALLFPVIANGATVQLTDSVGGLIPDGSTAGLARTLVLDRPGEEITSITVDISISGTSGSFPFLGDLYFYLSDGTSLVTLANRAGRDSGTLDGYDDSVSMMVTFSDLAFTDFHVYRPAVTGNSTTALSGPLTGSFQPDGRDTLPTSVVTGDARTSQLSDFLGVSAERTFTLFAADLSGGAEHQIDSLTLNVETVQVPEPSLGLLSLASACLLMFKRWR